MRSLNLFMSLFAVCATLITSNTLISKSAQADFLRVDFTIDFGTPGQDPFVIGNPFGAFDNGQVPVLTGFAILDLEGIVFPPSGQVQVADFTDVATDFSLQTASQTYKLDDAIVDSPAPPGGPFTNDSVTSLFGEFDSFTVDLESDTNVAFLSLNNTFSFQEGKDFSNGAFCNNCVTFVLSDVENPTDATPVPLPAALPLFALALAGFGVLRLRRPSA